MPADTIVTVRMPQSLLEEVKKHTTEDHYSDISEQIRSVIRQSCLRHSDPVRLGLDQLQQHVLHQMEDKLDTRKNEEILAEIKKLMGGAQ